MTPLDANDTNEQCPKKNLPKIAGYLPQDAKQIGQWLSTQVAAAQVEKETSGTNYYLQPSILELQQCLDATPKLKKSVERMIAEGLLVHKKYDPTVKYHITSLEYLYMVLNYQIQKAPIFAPAIPHTAFPISGVFVYMMFTESGWNVFRNSKFNNKLRGILDAWCTYLDTSASLNVVTTEAGGWLSPESVVANNLDQLVTEAAKKADPVHWGFISFNDYFHRNIIKICRPIDGINNDAVVVSANDGTINRLARNVKREANFELKNQPYSLVNMLNNSVYVDRFVGGDVVQTFLSGHDYHRFHAPISGTIVGLEIIPAFMFSELLSEGFDSSAGTHSQEYEANVNTRALIFIKSDDPKIGMVCVMPIGITEISSIEFHEDIKVNAKVLKGTLLGSFSYGGSSLCVIFERGAIKQFTVVEPNKGVNSNNGPFVRVNAQIAIANTTST